MRRNYRFIISYDGTRYFGWEHQPNTEMTIQGKLETVLSRMTGESSAGYLKLTSRNPRAVIRS